MMDLPTFALENSKSMTEILSYFETITLDEMRDIRLMNRIDTKFVTTVPVLRRLLELASDEYYVQQVDGEVIAPYYTLYYDTEDCAMYNRHEVGHLERQKLRVRSYLHVGINYLEVKTKNNHGRTKKKRTAAEASIHRHGPLATSASTTTMPSSPPICTTIPSDSQSISRTASIASPSSTRARPSASPSIST